MTLVAGNLIFVNFILQHAAGPQHADDVRLLRLAQANDDVGGVLAEITIRPVDFKLLPIAAGENFDFGADR